MSTSSTVIDIMTKIAAEAEAMAMATVAVVAVAADARVTNTILADALKYL